MTRKRRFFTSNKSDLNVTPLIDILLVLIVIFMVITPVTPVGLNTSVPHAPLPVQPREREDILVLTIRSDGRIMLNQDTMEFGSVSSRLLDIFRTRNDRTVFVQAADDILFNEVALLIDTAKGAGAGRVGLMPDRIAEEE